MSTISAPSGLHPDAARHGVRHVVAASLSRARAAEASLKSFLERWSIPALRVAIGLVFVAFGALKFIPGASPLEPLVQATWGVLTFGLVGGQVAMVLTALIETIAGLALISGKFTRSGLVLLAVAFVGILSPIVFFTGELVTSDGPTLLGQYMAKNVVLIAAALVVASRALRGPSRSR